MGKQDQDSFSMASASSRPSVDQGRKTARWFSLRRMFRDIQRQRYASSSQKKRSLQIELDFRSASSRHSSPQYDRDVAIHSIEVISKDSTGSAHGSTGKGESSNAGRIDCPLCALQQPRENFPHIITCSHRACRDCLKQYLRIEITESRVNIACPECTEKLHPNDIQKILEDDVLIRKYEEFMLRRVLVLDPDARWCPAPDCGWAWSLHQVSLFRDVARRDFCGVGCSEGFNWFWSYCSTFEALITVLYLFWWIWTCTHTNGCMDFF